MKTALLFSGQGERGLVSTVKKELQNMSPLLKRALNIIDCSVNTLINKGGRALEVSHVLQPIRNVRVAGISHRAGSGSDGCR